MSIAHANNKRPNNWLRRLIAGEQGPGHWDDVNVDDHQHGSLD